MNKYKKITLDGLIFQNPTFMLVLGTCPTLALINSATSALGMGLTVLVVLTHSNIIISALRKVIPNAVRIPCYIVIIATLVTLARMVLEKFIPDLYDALGGFLSLIVVNCIILGRAEAFANKNGVFRIRSRRHFKRTRIYACAYGDGHNIELLGAGSLFGLKLWSFKISIFATPGAGTFLIYGLSIAVFTYIIDCFERSRRVKANKLARSNMLGEAQKV